MQTNLRKKKKVESLGASKAVVSLNNPDKWLMGGIGITLTEVQNGEGNHCIMLYQTRKAS
jgi:hypothetical protein